MMYSMRACSSGSSPSSASILRAPRSSSSLALTASAWARPGLATANRSPRKLATLLDVAASGENLVEREGLSVRHPARFVLIGSGNPEEGELRPQLLDRFGLSVEVRTPQDLPTRVQVVRLRDDFEHDPPAFLEKWKRKDGKVRKRITDAQAALPAV